jgi:two-component system, cell cycle sensor histidine kinase and response regulator CckA
VTPPPIPLRVLIVEDSEPDAGLILRELRRGGFAPTHERVQTAEALRAALARQPWDIVLSDYYLPGFDAPAALAVLQERGDDLPFIVISGSVGEDTAVAVMRSGATDYLMKDRLQRLAPTVTRALEGVAVRREHRQLQEQLFHAQKMEAIGRLAGGVAHDFNNVLTAILGSAELLLLDTPRDAARREEVEIIRDAATRAQHLIRQLLAFSSRQVLQPAVVDLNVLVRDVAKMLRRLIGEDVALAIESTPDLGAVRVDPGQIEQVLVNLVVNSRDAMPDGGRLTIRTDNVDAPAGEPGDLPAGRYVRLEVADTGVGMDHETLGRVFEPFFTTKTPGKGTGLGLSMVYGIVRQSGGRIAAESAPGAGTTFRIYLPRVEAAVDAAPQAPPVAAPPKATGAETVLVAEDEHMVRVLVRKVLEQAGYTVLLAASGEEALHLEARYEGTIHLLVSDVVMPGMNGRELMRRLVLRRPAVKVLYLSGYSDDAVERHGVLDPGTAFMQKPFTPGALARRVRELLD